MQLYLKEEVVSALLKTFGSAAKPREHYDESL